MHAQHHSNRSSADGVVRRGARVEDLAQLYAPEVGVASAPLSPSARALLHAATLVDAGERRILTRVETPDGVPERGGLEPLAVHDSDYGSAWTAHLEEATEVFASLLGARSVGVRLVVSDAPHCPRFHVDQVVARGVMAVIGPGTEWLLDEHLDRRHLGHAGGLGGDTTSGLVRDWSQLQQARPSELVVFKGTAWPDAAGEGVVHRSPPADGIRRVVLTFDWLE